MADEDKKDGGSGKSGDEPSTGSEFKDIGSIGESDWAGALDEWDDVFDGLDAAKEPSQPVKLPIKTESATSDVAADPPAQPDASGSPEDQPVEPSPEETAGAAKDDATAAPELSADLTPAPPESVAAQEPAAEEPARSESARSESARSAQSDELDFLTSGEFEFEMEAGEALGDMLSSEMDGDIPPTPSHPSLAGLEDLAPEATDDVDLPDAPTDSQVFDFRTRMKAEEADRGEPEIADMDALRDASKLLAQKNAEVKKEAFDESTRMVAVEDQMRMAQDAMEHSVDEGVGLEFEESTRLVSAADQMRMAGESVLATEEESVAEVEAEVTLTVDDEFYDDFSIEDADHGPAPDLDFGEAEEAAPAQEAAPDLDFGEAEEAAPVEPSSDEITPARPHMAVPPDALRDDADDVTPVPGQAPDADATPVPADDPVSVANAEMAAALDGLAESVEAPAAQEPEPEPEPEPAPESDIAEPEVEPAEVELSFEADVPEADSAEVELSFEAEEPAGEAPAAPKDATEDTAEESADSEDAGLSSLDAMLGLKPDGPEETPESEPEGEGDLSSLDALLGIADGAPAPAEAEVSPVGLSVGESDTPSERLSDFGMDLPDPPAEPRLANLQSLADEEEHPSSPPLMDDLEPLPEAPVVGNFPEFLEPEPQAAERWERVVELISAQVDEAQDSGIAASLQTAAGELLEFRLGRDEEAMARYFEASTLDGEHRGCRRALVRCGLNSEDWGAALESLAVLRESESSAEQGAYGALAADLALATMGDADKAKTLYSELADRPAESLFGLLGLSDVAVFNGDQALLASSLRRMVELIKSEEIVAPIAVEAGRRLEVSGDDEGAAIVYLRATADSGELANGARDGLARLAMREGRWEETAENIRGLVTQIDPGAQRTDAAVALTRILSRRMDRLDDAVAAAEGAAREDPERLAVQIRLARLCQESGNWEAAIGAWKSASEAARDDHLKAAMQLWAGLLMEQHQSDAEGALECFRAAHEQDNTLAAASLAIGDVQGRSADADARIEAKLARASAAAESADQAAQKVLAAREMVRADRPQEGLQLLASARASGLDSRGLLRDLVQLAIAQGDTDQACDVLLQLGELVEPEAAVAVRSRAACLVAQGLQEGRQDPYRETFALDAALGHLAWGAQRALRAAGADEEWDKALAAEAESTADAARGARLWRLLGTSRRMRGTPREEALVAFEHAVALQSTDASTRESMAGLYAAQGNWVDCARLLGEAAEAAPVATHKALLQLRRAVCLEQQLDAPDQAGALYQELGEQFPSWALPMDTLVRLRVWSGDRLKTAEILTAQATQAATDADRVPLLIRAAAELDFGGDIEAAIRALQEAKTLLPGNPVAEVPYHHLENELGNWSVLADHALSIAKDTEDENARLEAYEELARIDRDGRLDFPSAVLGYESIVRLAPDHQPSLRELELYYPAEQRFHDLGSIAAKIAGATEGVERAANAMEWARFRQEPNQRDELVEALRMAVRADPDSLFALARLESHALREGWRDELALIHRAVAEQYRDSPSAQAVFLRRAAESHAADGANDKAVEALTEAITAAPDYLPAAEERLRLELASEQWPGVLEGAEALANALRRRSAKAEAYLLAGAVAEERLGDGERAISAFEAVLALEPKNRAAFSRLRNLYEARQNWPELARLINARLEVAESGTATCELLWDLAQVERDRLDDANSAKVTLKRLIGMDDSHLEAVQAATELYEGDEQWVEMADMLIRQARLEKEPQKLSEIFFRLGVLYDDKIPDPKRAAASFSKVVTINQRDIRALERLSAIHVKNEEWKGALAVTGRLVETETKPERRIDHLITLSQILEGGYRDPRRAREALLKAVEVDPQSLKAVGELATFYGRQNDRRSLMVHLDRSVTNVRTQLATDPYQGDAYRSLAKLFEWRRAPDQQACAAAALTAIGEGGDREREILSTVGKSRPRWDALKDPELDEILYPRSINSGFRHTMRLLGGSLGKPYRDDLSTYGASRGTRLPKSGHPLRDVANEIGEQLGVSGFDLHVVSDRPGLLIVEPYDPPAIIVGSALAEGGSPAELAFIAGRCLKMIQANMVLPAKLNVGQLQALVAGIVRQYQPDFEPTEVKPAELQERTKLVGKAMPRKVKSELMPFALGCAGISDYAQLGRDIARVANMSGLLACGDLGAAVNVLLRMAGKTPGKKSLAKLAKGLVEIEQLLQFAVSEEYFELRRRVGLASGSGPRF